MYGVCTWHRLASDPTVADKRAERDQLPHRNSTLKGQERKASRKVEREGEGIDVKIMVNE